MSPFVFSMDSHVVEPRTLWQDGLPARLRDRALRAERRDGYLVMTADGKDLHRMQVGDGNSDNPRIGGTSPELRFQDMRKDGIDGELIFPNLGMMTYAIDDGELSFACMQVYNDWLIKNFGAFPDTFVPTAVLPMRDVAQTLDEFKRVVALGYRSVMLPTLPPLGLRYNNKEFDPVWAYAQDKSIPLAFHVASGLTPITERGPGRGDRQLHAARLRDRGAGDLHGRRRRARPPSRADDGRHRGRRVVDGRARRAPRRSARSAPVLREAEAQPQAERDPVTARSRRRSSSTARA